MRNATGKSLFLLVILSLVLAACAPAAAPALAGEAGAAEPIKLTHWIGVGTGGSEQAECTIANVVEPYNEMTEGVTVETVLQPNVWEAMRTAVAGGGGPDIVTTPGPSFVFEMAKSGQLLPLSDYAEQLGWADTFAPWALSLGLVEGELYSVPHELETLILYYNKTVFEENGWTPPATFDEMVALSQQIADAGIIPFAHTNGEWRAANEWFIGEFLNHVSGPDNVYLALTGQKPWTDPEFVEAIDLLTDMQLNGWFMGGLDRYYTGTDDERRVMLGDGVAAMTIEGTWALDNMSNYFGEAAGNNNEWDVIAVPSVTGEDIYDLGIGSTYSINAASPNPDAAAEFLTYYFSPESQATLLVECGVAPAPVTLTEEQLTGLDPRFAKAFAGLTQASDEGNYGYTTWTFWPPKSDVYIYEEIEKVWAGQITSEQYLQGLQDLFQEELEAGDIPPIPEREVSS
ncbi:MAG: extracellular solute-binding protein [Chloroflexota bacterium]|nr:extracellular solute-binding protein [Chloroflexota bacterium]